MNAAQPSFSAIVAQSPARQRITGNLPFDEWTFARSFGPVAVAGSPFGSGRLTDALPDRLTHHVNILGMNGESYRLGPKQGPRDKAKSDTNIAAIWPCSAKASGQPPDL